MIGLLLVAALWAPGVDTEAHLIKAIKEAERAAFEQHRAGVYFALFTPDAVWVQGRREVPDAHDVTLTRARKEALLRLELAAPPTRHDRLFFETPEVDLAGNPPTVKVRIGRHFFGGNDLIGVHYTLRRVGGTFKVAAVRTWPIEEKVALSHIEFDDAYFREADARVEAAGTPTPEELLESLRWARRFGEAHALAVRTTQAPNATAAQWLLRAHTALWVGDLDDARAAVKRAQAIDPLAEPPPLLRTRK